MEEETHLRLKTERMVVISDILAWRDGRTYGRTDGRTQPLTEMRWTHLKSIMEGLTTDQRTGGPTNRWMRRQIKNMSND